METQTDELSPILRAGSIQYKDYETLKDNNRLSSTSTVPMSQCAFLAQPVVGALPECQPVGSQAEAESRTCRRPPAADGDTA